MPNIYLTMPQPGETITEGLIVRWIASEGDVIKEGQPVAELETEKAMFEHESPFEGKILKILYPAETRVKVAEPIALMEVSQQRADHYVMLGIGRLADSDTGTPVSVKSQTPMTNASVQKINVAEPAAVPVTAGDLKNLSDVKMSPYVRRVALSAGVAREALLNLASAHAEGRVTKEAILSLVDPRFAAETAPGSPVERRQASQTIAAQPTAGDGFTVMPFSPIRNRIAENMALSKSKIPHAHTGLWMDVSKVVNFRNRYKDDFKKRHGTNLNFLTLFAPAICAAIRKVPQVNASFYDEGAKPEIRLFNRINLGVAVGSESGLIIPVVKDADGKDLKAFNADLSDKIERGMNKKLKPDDFLGSTIIFNNFGFFGITYGVQIIQYPLAATLGMGVIEKRPIVIGDAIAVRDVADLFIAFDHRIIDGREAGNFLTAIKQSVENFAMRPEDLAL